MNTPEEDPDYNKIMTATEVRRRVAETYDRLKPREGSPMDLILLLAATGQLRGGIELDTLPGQPQGGH